MTATYVVDRDLELAMNNSLGAIARDSAWSRYEGRRWSMFLATHPQIREASLTDTERRYIRLFRV